MLSSRRIYWPALSLLGPGCVQEVGEEVLKLGLKKALVVSDEVLEKIGIVEKVTDILNQSKIEFAVFTDVKPNPTTQNVNDGLATFQREQCDFIISIGGGSPQDAAKAIGILYTNGGDIVSYEGVGKSKNKSVPIIAINTTAGTASEVTINYVITDEFRKIKMVMVDPNSLAIIAVNDPELMIGKPASLTAATGMDALTHAIEAYVTKGAFELTDVLAYRAIEFIASSLEAAVLDGQNIEARSGMAWGSYVAGLSFSNCGLGIVHSMAHQLGSEYDMPHGVANAILLPFVMEFNLDACPAKFARIAKALGKDTDHAETEYEAAGLALEAVLELSAKLGIPKLSETSYNPDDINKLAEQAMRDVCTGGNPKATTLEDIKAIYTKAYMA